MNAIDNSKTEIIRGFSLLWSLLAIFVCFDGQKVYADFVGSAFTYQGRLSEQGNPANGFYDLLFSLYDAETNGSLIGTVTQTANHVVNGTFTATLDFGSVFDGNPRWLDIAVRTNGSSEFTSMVPRQLITAVPYASYSTYSGVSARAKNVAAADIVGGISLQQLPGEIATSNAVASQGSALSNLTLFASNSIEARITAAVFCTNVVFVAQNGNDSLAARNDPTRRFLTISNALKSAHSGDLIEIGAGRWDECLSIKNNVNYHLCEGASVNGVVVNVDTFRGGWKGNANVAPWTWVYGEGVIEATNANGVQFNASANLAIDIRRLHVDSKVAAVWVSGYSSFWLKTKERVDGGIHSKYINDQSGEIFVDIPGILRGCTFDGLQWIYWRGDIADTPFVNSGRVDRGYNGTSSRF